MIIPASEWKPIAENIFEHPGMVMLFGAIDTGKSSFAQYLVEQGVERGLKVALVDADMGQSTLGPPATIGMKIYSNNSAIRPSTSLRINDHQPAIDLHFIGATAPVGHLVTTLVGVKKLVDKALQYKSDLVIVDTTGLVYGSAAIELKFRKVELLNPQYLIAFQRKDEIEHLLLPYHKVGNRKVYRLPVSDKVISRKPETRRAYRKQKFAEYFAAAKLIEISINDIAFHHIWFNSGRKLNRTGYEFLEKTLDTSVLYGEKTGNTINLVVSGDYERSEQYNLESRFGIANIDIIEFELLQNLLVGLNDQNNETLALGLIQDIDFQTPKITLLTPISDIAYIRLLEFGFIWLDNSGNELRQQKVIE
jgi:polynucleotide 5'-hydroxyl-kinase GRC3/NOL9